jgi:hypothetical protein
LLLHAIAHLYGDVVAFSHHSSCALRGYALFGQDLTNVHVRRLDGGSGRREAGIIHHKTRPNVDDLEVVDGLLATRASLALWESGLNVSTEGALVTINDALHAKSVTADELAEVTPRFAYWPRGRHVRLAVRMSDTKVESVGETRGLYLFWEQGIPRPDTQYEVISSTGLLIGRTDYAWVKHRHLGEFDGMVKYRRSWKVGEDPGDVVQREKAREDEMRGERHGMSRLIWSDYARDRRVQKANKIKRELDQSYHLYARRGVTIVL